VKSLPREPKLAFLDERLGMHSVCQAAQAPVLTAELRLKRRALCQGGSCVRFAEPRRSLAGNLGQIAREATSGS